MINIILLADIHLPTLTPQKSNKFKYQNTIENNFHVNRLMLLAEKVNLMKPTKVYILGDLLDSTNINLCTLEVLKSFVNLINVDVYYLNGNHERINQNEYLLDFLDIGMKPLLKHFTLHNTAITALNHNETFEAPHLSSDILLGHFRWSLPTFWGQKGELSKKDLIKVVNNYKDIILGDIHAEYQPEDNVTYINQPYSHKYLPQSPKGLVELQITEEGYEIIRHHLDLPNKILLTCKFNELEDILANLDDKHLYKIRVSLDINEVESLPTPSNKVIFDLVINGQDTNEVMVVEKENVLNTLLSVLPEENKEYIKGLLND